MEKPNSKVGSSGIAGAITVVLVWAYGGAEQVLGFSYPLTPEVAAGITGIVMFGVGYMVRD